MTVLILMAVVFLGACGVAAGCKWGGARLGWLSFLAVAAAGAFLVLRHGVWPLIPPALAWLVLMFAWWAFVPRDDLPRNRVGGRTSGCTCTCTRAVGTPPPLNCTGTGGGSPQRGKPVTRGRT